jgi:hypothetical protein
MARLTSSSGRCVFWGGLSVGAAGVVAGAWYMVGWVADGSDDVARPGPVAVLGLWAAVAIAPLGLEALELGGC